MKNKILTGVLITTLGIGGMVYASGDANKNIKSVDYKVDTKQSVENKTADKREATSNETNDRKENTNDTIGENENFRTCYGMGRNHRRLTDEELKDLRESGDFNHHLGMTKEEYDNLTEAERKELFGRVKENRNLSDGETEKLITSGRYCHYYDMTEEEYEKLSDSEREELFKNHEYGGYRHYRRHNNYIDGDSKEDLDRNYRNGSHHGRGHHRRGYCH